MRMRRRVRRGRKERRWRGRRDIGGGGRNVTDLSRERTRPLTRLRKEDVVSVPNATSAMNGVAGRKKAEAEETTIKIVRGDTAGTGKEERGKMKVIPRTMNAMTEKTGEGDEENAREIGLDKMRSGEIGYLMKKNRCNISP